MNPPESFRPLKSNELVRSGDFIVDDRAGLKPWEGLNGFRADSYVVTVYRKLSLRITEGIKNCANT